MLRLTDRAAEALARSASAATRFAPEATLRVAPAAAPGGVELSIVDGPRPGDATIEGSGFRLHVDPSLSGTLDVAEPHETFVLSPDA